MSRQAEALKIASLTDEVQEQTKFRNNGVVKLENPFF